MYGRYLRYEDAAPDKRANLIPMDYEQYDAWSENARLAYKEYSKGKLTAEEFLQRIDTGQDLDCLLRDRQGRTRGGNTLAADGGPRRGLRSGDPLPG